MVVVVALGVAQRTGELGTRPSRTKEGKGAPPPNYLEYTPIDQLRTYARKEVLSSLGIPASMMGRE